jgi:hypothetical protein
MSSMDFRLSKVNLGKSTRLAASIIEASNFVTKSFTVINLSKVRAAFIILLPPIGECWLNDAATKNANESLHGDVSWNDATKLVMANNATTTEIMKWAQNAATVITVH